jgi:hypothetical protein
MNTKLSNKEIGSLLNRSAQQLDRSTLNELHTARQQALQNQRVASPVWVSRNGLLHGQLRLSPRALNWFIVGVVASLLVINLTYWERTYEHDHSDIDIAILTDDMPVDAFVD